MVQSVRRFLKGIFGVLFVHTYVHTSVQLTQLVATLTERTLSPSLSRPSASAIPPGAILVMKMLYREKQTSDDTEM